MTTPEPTFNAYGYPTEEILKAIEGWDYHDSLGLMRFIQRAWKNPDTAQEVRSGRWVFATGGWAWNEDLMEALENSRALLFIDHLYIQGGRWIFALTEEAKEELRIMEETIFSWAWGKRGPT